MVGEPTQKNSRNRGYGLESRKVNMLQEKTNKENSKRNMTNVKRIQFRLPEHLRKTRIERTKEKFGTKILNACSLFHFI